MKLRKLSAMAMATAMMVAAIGGTNAFATTPTEGCNGIPVYGTVDSAENSTLVKLKVDGGNATVYVPSTVTLVENASGEYACNYDVYIEDGIGEEHEGGLLDDQVLTVKTVKSVDEQEVVSNDVTLTADIDSNNTLTANMNFNEISATENVEGSVGTYSITGAELVNEDVVSSTAKLAEGEEPSIAASWSGSAIWNVTLSTQTPEV